MPILSIDALLWGEGAPAIMFVEKWMTPNPFTLPPDTTISAAALEMSKHHFRHLLVTESGQPVRNFSGF